MRIAFINQTFYPDVVSSGQHLADLALRLAERDNKCRNVLDDIIAGLNDTVQTKTFSVRQFEK